MKQLIKVPSVGESITQATIGQWQKNSGDYVQQNEVLVVMETDKASMDLPAEKSGQLTILKKEGEDVQIGEVIAELDTSIEPPKTTQVNSSDKTEKPSTSQTLKPENELPSDKILVDDFLKKTSSLSTDKALKDPTTTNLPPQKTSSMSKTLSPAVKKLVLENNLNPMELIGTGPKDRITKSDVLNFLDNKSSIKKQAIKEQTIKKQTMVDKASSENISTGSNVLPASLDTSPSASNALPASLEQSRERMTTIRRRIAERLVESQHNSATLTTFNEVDMSKVMALRIQYKDHFIKKHNIKLGFMSFFIKAVIHALKEFPKVNAFIEGNEIVYNHACHIGVAVSTDKGLVVPVIRNTELKGMAEIEKEVLFYAKKAREGRINPDDLMGGTFTITNGGVFGSLMSTPILNPPQSGILGMHKIEQRPVVINGKIEIKPMMYLALSYDHRIVDGKESVGFLVKIKECIEDPIRLVMNV